MEINIHQAKTHLSKLLERVAAGETITIARAGVPIARLVAIEPSGGRPLGLDQGRYEVPEDFDAPLPRGVLKAFGMAEAKRPKKGTRRRIDLPHNSEKASVGPVPHRELGQQRQLRDEIVPDSPAREGFQDTRGRGVHTSQDSIDEGIAIRLDQSTEQGAKQRVVVVAEY